MWCGSSPNRRPAPSRLRPSAAPRTAALPLVGGGMARWLLGPRAPWGAVFRPPAAASGVFRFYECGGLRFGVLPLTQLMWASRFASSCSASLRAVGRSGRAGTALVLRSSLRCGCSSCALGICGCSLCFYHLTLAALQGHSCCIRLRSAACACASCCHRCAPVSISARCARFGGRFAPT